MTGSSQISTHGECFTTTTEIISPEADHSGEFRPFPHKYQPSHHRRAGGTGRSRTAIGARVSSADRPIHAQYV
ncbi:hypothetical protein BS329_26765 [Amycolatopsis coloradensis]|uniref:Uncharacterized protein n=1 Tax=Amycolatopsis coloradensis TaxID=76021 RepID=A0A1R0KLI5_9PSEU|nr:hypothetical protein BS329_26765 [Amycolatopsis coloradensis]